MLLVCCTVNVTTSERGPNRTNTRRIQTAAMQRASDTFATNEGRIIGRSDCEGV